MRDHITWRANWHVSEYKELSAYERDRIRHALAACLGALTAVPCSGLLVYLVF